MHNKHKTIKQLIKERDNCLVCNSDQYKVIYKGKRKHPEARYFKKLQCLVCAHTYTAESKSEFNERLKDYM